MTITCRFTTNEQERRSKILDELMGKSIEAIPPVPRLAYTEDWNVAASLVGRRFRCVPIRLDSTSTRVLFEFHDSDELRSMGWALELGYPLPMSSRASARAWAKLTASVREALGDRGTPPARWA